MGIASGLNVELREFVPKRLCMVGDKDLMFPAQAFFNTISDNRFVFISNLLQGIDAGFDAAYYQFPSDLAPSDEPFEGVKFSLYEDGVVVDHQTFMQYLKLACKEYKEHPEHRHKPEHLLQSAQTPT